MYNKKKRYKQTEPPKQKKVKISTGPDIPSINLIANQKTKLVGNKAQLINKSQITSVPYLPLKQEKDATKILHKMHIPDKFKEVLGPNMDELKRFDQSKKKKEAQMQTLIKKGLIADPKLQKLHQQLREQTELVQENKSMPSSVQMDERGVTRDSKGNQITISKKLVSSLKVNLKKEKEEKVKQMLKKHARGANIVTASKFFDQNLRITPRIKKEKKRSQAFQFIEKGSILDKSLQVDSKGNINQQTSIPHGLKRVAVKVRHHDPIPDVEWWDLPLMPENQKSYLETEQENVFEIKEKAITNLIEHPPAFRTSGVNVNVSVPMYLTKEERKKIRRKKALEKQKEMQDKIKLGLMKPPPPKVKMSNLMRVLGPEAVADPSRIEKEVKKNIQERLKSHLQRNKANKLTKEQRTEKWLRKLKRDSAIECRVAVFRIEKVTSKAIKFKLDKSAQQYALHGICLISDCTILKGIPSLVIVEGGPKAIKQYKKLVLKRIQWHKIEDESLQQQLQIQPNQLQVEESKKKKWASLIWEGVIKDHLFKRWQVFEFKSEMEGKRYLTEKGVDYYWDMVLTYETNFNDQT